MKTTACTNVADYVWLTGDEAHAALDELAGDDTPLHLLVSRLRARFSAARTHLLLEQVDLRRRAAAKFTRASQMFFTRVGLEQATDEWVAAYKASRFANLQADLSLSKGPNAVADLCCGIGGDLIALSNELPTIGVDLDPIVAHFAAINARATVPCTDVTEFDFIGITALHIDPDRRPTGRRTTSLDACQPDAATIRRLIRGVPNAAVKLAPATRVPADWSERCELEWISRDRECRQLVAWHGELAQTPGQHRATILSATRHSALSSWSKGALAPRTVFGTPNQPFPIVQQVDRYIFDVDAAVLAAHLKGTLTAEHALSSLSNGPNYLTGPSAIEDAALACFEVTDVLPFEPRKLASYFGERSIGRLEIKKRGVDIEPERLRRSLKLRGENDAVLLVTSVDGRITAIVARRT